MTTLTLQINNKAALERLLGGDSEIEVELRKSVAKAFVELHFTKDIQAQASGLARELREVMANTISAQIGEIKRGWNGNIERVTLKQELIDEIRRTARSAFEECLREFYKEQREEAEARLLTHAKIAVRDALAQVNKTLFARIAEAVSTLVISGTDAAIRKLEGG